MIRSRVALVISSLVLAAACSSGDAGASEDSAPVTTAETATTSTTDAVESTESLEDADTADDPAGDAPASFEPTLEAAGELALGLINGDSITETTYETVFAPAFQEQLGFEEFVAVLPQLTAGSPWSVDRVLLETDTELTRKVDSADGTISLVLQVIIEPADTLQIETLFLTPFVEPVELASIDEGIEMLETEGQLRLVIAEVTNGTCVASRDVAADEQAPLGSVFKLYVLAAVLEAIDAGEVDWNDPIEIRDELDSIPSGITQDDEPGSELSVRELAERMISISDNTATDHLIDLVGRDAVVEAMVASGHSDPSLNDPMMTTREFTIVKFAGFANRWADGDRDERVAILDEVAGLDLPPVFSITSVIDPILVEEVEWFASPNDLCRLMVDLGQDPDALEIMSINPGIDDPDGRWTSIGFKGGSEPGVLASVWLMSDADGRSFVLAGSLSNEDRLLDEMVTLSTWGAMRDLVGLDADG